MNQSETTLKLLKYVQSAVESKSLSQWWTVVTEGTVPPDYLFLCNLKSYLIKPSSLHWE